MRKAEAVTGIVRRSQDIDLTDFATKADLKSELNAAELRLEAKIAAVKSNIVTWLFGAIGAQTVVILGAMIPLGKLFH